MRYVFVYGTLRAGEINDIIVAAARNEIMQPRLLGRAAVAGRLFDFGSYPGMIADAYAAPVLGEVYEIDDALVPVLDDIEKVYPGVPGLFLSQQVEVEVEGRQMACLFYPVAPERADGRPEIHGGDWVAHRLAR
ncbi:gamma-glutamylcyclotransferase family protein [Paraburkholderia dinghuensis]|uniref:Gamma-glutamylcyclotransferase n=1 Tax=Paraburkholderia dinghuensis TaxID=2305225 RepID=A0A3N6NH23_9BURK|nr:gamma-glutamylcyclotransferase family protein [Paraburkholderia dinghuensis]RQH08027.1 gamma-glutamylcyclotransferase [Paraburkholderia dinghuensis]